MEAIGALGWVIVGVLGAIVVPVGVVDVLLVNPDASEPVADLPSTSIPPAGTTTATAAPTTSAPRQTTTTSRATTTTTEAPALVLEPGNSIAITFGRRT